jgi:hypothetical protein
MTCDTEKTRTTTRLIAILVNSRGAQPTLGAVEKPEKQSLL